MSDHLGGVRGDFNKPEVMAEALLNAARERFSGMSEEQKPKSSVGVMRAAVSHLSKREERETGRVHAGSPAAKAQSALAHAEQGEGGQVEQRLREAMRARGF